MNREVVLVMGMTGYGKSWWSKLYHRLFSRSIVYDPVGSFPVKEWLQPDEIYERLTDEQPPKEFQYGFISQDESHVSGIGALTFTVGQMVYFIEECATVFEKGVTRSPQWVKTLCFFGRHKACSLVLIAQRPTYIPIDIRSQANRVISFCQHEGSDMDWLTEFYGRERMKRLPNIEKFSCFDYHNGQVKEYSIKPLVAKHFGIILDSSNVMI